MFVSTIEELLARKSSDSGLESREYGRRKNPPRWLRGTLYPQKLALTCVTNGGRSVCKAQATEFVCLFVDIIVKGTLRTEDVLKGEVVL
jgi:hypothetical protein